MKMLRSSILSHVREDAKNLPKGVLKGQQAKHARGLVNLNRLLAQSERELKTKAA